MTEGNRIVRDTGRSEQHGSMTEYRPAQVPGTTWFFTVNLAERSGNRLLVDRIDALRGRLRIRSGAASLPNGSGRHSAGSPPLRLDIGAPAI